jgi:hypothetical protein
MLSASSLRHEVDSDAGRCSRASTRHARLEHHNCSLSRGTAWIRAGTNQIFIHFSKAHRYVVHCISLLLRACCEGACKLGHVTDTNTDKAVYQQTCQAATNHNSQLPFSMSHDAAHSAQLTAVHLFDSPTWRTSAAKRRFTQGRPSFLACLGTSERGLSEFPPGSRHSPNVASGNGTVRCGGRDV